MIQPQNTNHLKEKKMNEFNLIYYNSVVSIYFSSALKFLVSKILHQD